ncbi:MAG TPA: exo-alpha-sialidase [Tepidisphaeraceae bacterium]|nr:exo-alpha-sialidase [Tepidisphaeraceae bacterium]
MLADRISPRAVVRREFVFDSPPFPSCHAATLLEAGGALLAAWFGGTKEGHADVCVWMARRTRDGWSAPTRVADGIQSDGGRFPCWNPVLFQPRGGPVMLFYKVGPSPSKWWGMRKISEDAGHTWSPAERLPAGILGPAKNKPVQLTNGEIISPASAEMPEAGWHVYTERSSDGGRSFIASAHIAQGEIPKATQPSVLIHSQDQLQMIGRTTSSSLFESWSNDAGATWGLLQLMNLPNCNSGIDAVTLAAAVNGQRHLLVYNHSNLEKVRYPLNVAVSPDGRSWFAAAELESAPPGQYSYPCVIQSQTGNVHVAYTYKRRTICHVELDPGAFELQPIEAFACPPPGSPTHRSDEFQ